MLQQLQAILSSFAANPSQPISQVSLLPEGERDRLVLEWNATAAEYPRQLCMHQIFEEQVARAPEADAVVLNGQHLSYRALNARATS